MRASFLQIGPKTARDVDIANFAMLEVGTVNIPANHRSKARHQMRRAAIVPLLALALLGTCDKPPPAAEIRPVRTVTAVAGSDGEPVGHIRAQTEESLAFRIDGRMIAGHVDAERETLLRSGVDMAGEGYRFSVRARARRDGPNGPDFGRWLRLVAGSQKNQA